MKIKLINKGFNYSQDGPGNRLVYHLLGCNMHCPWCANPEGMDMAGSMMTEKNGTSHLSFQETDTDTLIAEVLSARPILIDGGGVTFSGGEPTLQFEALKEILEELHHQGIHTAIETNGTSPRLPELVPFLDLLIADLKHPDPELHRRYTGQNNQQTISNLRDLSKTGIPIWIRTPLINGVNASAECREGFIQIYTQGFQLENVSFELLSYHEYGAAKWAQCGKEYTVKDGYVSQKTVKEFEEAYRQAGLHVIRT